MNVKKKAVWFAMLFIAAWLFLPGDGVQAADSEVRVLEITRGDYNNPSDCLTPGPQDDGKNFSRMLGNAYGESNISVVTYEREGVTTVSGLQAVIQDTFAESDDDDINYFYYSGHGTSTGLCLESNAIMSAADLAEGFDGIKGTNILVIDCCYSGVMTVRAAGSTSGAADFVDAFVDEFEAAVEDGTSGTASRSALTNSSFKLLMASTEDELSWQMGFSVTDEEGSVHDVEVGGFTMTLCYGCGIDPIQVWNETAAQEDYALNVASADYDLNGEVSIEEIKTYVENTYHYSANHVRSYPADDSSCFVPVNESQEPKITFSSAYINTEKNSVDICYSTDSSVTVDYAVYSGISDQLSFLTYNGLGYDEKFSDLSEYVGSTATPTLVESVYGYSSIVEGARNDYVIRISLDDYSDGNYYVVLQTEGQEMRYLIPFALATETNTSLEDSFQILLSGDSYTASDSDGGIGTFVSSSGSELTIRADFGTGKSLDLVPPYISCYVYDSNGNWIRTIGSRELMDSVPIYNSSGTAIRVVNYYRNFYWDGNDSDGHPVSAGTYQIRIIATGSATIDETMSVILRHDDEVPGLTYLAMSQSEITLPLSDDSARPSIIFLANADGTVALSLERTDGDETVEEDLNTWTAVAGQRLTVLWDCTIGGETAPAGTYVINAVFTPEEEGVESSTATSESFTVVWAETAEEIEIPEEGLQAEFTEGKESVVLLSYTLNFATDVYAGLYDTGGNLVATLVNGEVEAGEQQITWDGKDNNGEEVSSGTYLLNVFVTDASTGAVKVLVYQAEVSVTGLTEDSGTTEPTEPETDSTGSDTDSTEPSTEQTSTDMSSAGTSTDSSSGNATDSSSGAATDSQGTTAASDKDAQTDQEVLPDSVSIQVGTKTVKKITAGVKEKIQLTAVIAPENADDQDVTYTSSNNKVATVSASGKVTAKKKGKAVITVTTENGKTASVTITVKDAPKKITLSAKSKTLKVGKTYKVKVKFPSKTASYKVTFTSSKKSVATVDENGKITALKKGKTVITAKTFNGKKAKITITVK